MNVTIKRVLYFPITKIIIGIVVCFSLFVVIQNFVLKPFFLDLCVPEQYLPNADSTIKREYRNSWIRSHWHTRIITLNYTRTIE